MRNYLILGLLASFIFVNANLANAEPLKKCSFYEIMNDEDEDGLVQNPKGGPSTCYYTQQDLINAKKNPELQGNLTAISCSTGVKQSKDVKSPLNSKPPRETIDQDVTDDGTEALPKCGWYEIMNDEDGDGLVQNPKDGPSTCYYLKSDVSTAQRIGNSAPPKCGNKPKKEPK